VYNKHKYDHQLSYIYSDKFDELQAYKIIEMIGLITKESNIYPERNLKPWTTVRMFPYASTLSKLPYNLSNQRPLLTKEKRFFLI
jgi:hypothetical protein